MMDIFKPSEWMRMMYYCSVSEKGILGKKEIRVLLSGVEPKGRFRRYDFAYDLSHATRIRHAYNTNRVV